MQELVAGRIQGDSCVSRAHGAPDIDGDHRFLVDDIDEPWQVIEDVVQDAQILAQVLGGVGWE